MKRKYKASKSERKKSNYSADRQFGSIQTESKRLQKQSNQFTKVAEYKINSQKPEAFLYANNKSAEKVIQPTPYGAGIGMSKINHLQFHLGVLVRVLTALLPMQLSADVPSKAADYGPSNEPCPHLGD